MKHHAEEVERVENEMKEREEERKKKRKENEKEQTNIEKYSGYSAKVQRKLNIQFVIDLCIRDLQPFRMLSRACMRNIMNRHDHRFKPTDHNGASDIVSSV